MVTHDLTFLMSSAVGHAHAFSDVNGARTTFASHFAPERVIHPSSNASAQNC